MRAVSLFVLPLGFWGRAVFDVFYYTVQNLLVILIESRVEDLGFLNERDLRPTVGRVCFSANISVVCPHLW